MIEEIATKHPNVWASFLLTFVWAIILVLSAFADYLIKRFKRMLSWVRADDVGWTEGEARCLLDSKAYEIHETPLAEINAKTGWFIVESGVYRLKPEIKAELIKIFREDANVKE